ncbi:MAG: hypothetical protein AAF411_00525 [Myxococcota bacterium]
MLMTAQPSFLRAFVTFALALGGCGSDSTEAATAFVGTTADGEVLIASFWGDDGAVFYACGRDATLDTSTAWVRVPRELEQRDVLFSAPSLELMATREDDALRAVLTRGDVSEMVQLAPIESDAEAGVFLREEGECRTAVIALPSEGGIRLQGAHFCAPGGPFFQVTPVRPVETLGDSLLVSFDDGGGIQELMLPRFGGL